MIYTVCNWFGRRVCLCDWMCVCLFLIECAWREHVYECARASVNPRRVGKINKLMQIKSAQDYLFVWVFQCVSVWVFLCVPAYLWFNWACACVCPRVCLWVGIVYELLYVCNFLCIFEKCEGVWARLCVLYVYFVSVCFVHKFCVCLFVCLFLFGELEHLCWLNGYVCVPTWVCICV